MMGSSQVGLLAKSEISHGGAVVCRGVWGHAPPRDFAKWK